MVLYNGEIKISFPQYGIAIPSLDSRKTRTMESLLNHPRLGPRKKEWLNEEIPLCIGRADLERAHSREYIDNLYGSRLEEALILAYELLDEEGNHHRYDPAAAEKPLPELLNDVLKVLAGSYRALRLALEEGFCYFLGGGMHHAHPGFGHGFCLLNDVGVAVQKARAEGLIRRVWIIDTDAHRGDGTAEIFGAIGDVKTLSIHMAKGWPLEGESHLPDGRLNPAWYPGDIDIPVQSGEEEEYLPRLMRGLEELARDGAPDLAFVVAGVDPYEKDELPSSALLELTREQMLSRDQGVYNFLAERNIPSAWVAAGGYGSSSWEIHAAFLEWVLLERLGGYRIER